MAEAKAKEEGESASSSEHTPPPSSPRQSRSPIPRERKKPKDIVSSLSICHSCDRLFPPMPQTLTSLQLLNSEWRIVLLCDECLRLVKSAAKCSFCFSDFSGDGRRHLDCRQCSCRIHLDCIPAQQRLISPSLLNPDSFVCVDCCALPRFGNKNPRRLFTMASVEELIREAEEKEAAAALAKEEALEKAEAAKCAANRAREALAAVVAVANTKPVDKDQELALQLHLAMNGSQRVSRSGRTMISDRSAEAKKVRHSNGRSRSLEKVEFCMEDKGFFDSWSSAVELGSSERKDLKEEADGCIGSSAVKMVVTEEQCSCSDKVANSSEDDSTLAVWITYKRASKSKGIGSEEKSSEMKQSLISIGAGEFSSESDQMSRCDPPDRYAKKYSKRKKLILEKVLDGKSRVVPC